MMMVIRKGETSTGGGGTEGEGNQSKGGAAFRTKARRLSVRVPNQPTPTVWKEIMGRQGSAACLSLEGQIKVIIVVMIRVVIRCVIRADISLRGSFKAKISAFTKDKLRGTLNMKSTSLLQLSSIIRAFTRTVSDKSLTWQIISIKSISTLCSGIFKSSWWGDPREKSCKILSVAIFKVWRDYHKATSVTWKATL